MIKIMFFKVPFQAQGGRYKNKKTGDPTIYILVVLKLIHFEPFLLISACLYNVEN